MSVDYDKVVYNEEHFYIGSSHANVEVLRCSDDSVVVRCLKYELEYRFSLEFIGSYEQFYAVLRRAVKSVLGIAAELAFNDEHSYSEWFGEAHKHIVPDIEQWSDSAKEHRIENWT